MTTKLVHTKRSKSVWMDDFQLEKDFSFNKSLNQLNSYGGSRHF